LPPFRQPAPIIPFGLLGLLDNGDFPDIRFRRINGWEGGYVRYYDYSIIYGSSNEGHTSCHEAEEIDTDIDTVEELAEYVEEYVQSINVDDWIKECQLHDYMKSGRNV
jgi:hypothetical protein